MFSFFVALSASAIALPSISSEFESGVLLTVVTRLVRRSRVLLGKWPGLAALLAVCAGVVCAGEFAAVDWVTGFLLPRTRWPPPRTCSPRGALLLTLAYRERSFWRGARDQARRLDFRTDRRCGARSPGQGSITRRESDSLSAASRHRRRPRAGCRLAVPAELRRTVS